ncbi:cytochrome c biogenesis protein [Mitsuaria sp. BK045]|uniref:cytochrome c biogenesis protein ResB n=1 Tax=unclassified Roseateles TaxID=2626991 RepID=UPI0017D874C7|nr:MULTISPECIES: cytochrome c biogenesis protein ResB [unclassified Roseateles]MBB3291637.1 cytochrome c biogenesis protein [Mitsuaria sp. BK041]MBB3360854.1 cytochrome c biogenesis protein [Mitsuaria sp. BK045]
MTEKSPDRPPRPAAQVAARVALDDAMELLASMRFAIALLTVICIASVIGTVVQQQQPMTNYVNQFGPFWSELFGKLDLYTVYSAWWFLLMLGFLVVSTSLCIARHTPRILRDLKTYKETMREQSIQAFKLKALGYLHMNPEAALGQVNAWLAAEGWKARAQVRTGGVMIGARKGAAHKIGYLAAHSAIVLICVGGLLDGNLIVRAIMWAQGKQIYQGADLNQMTAVNRLGTSNPSFRGNLFVPEGSRSSTALLSMPTGVVVQDLPFDVELKKFIVEYYATGMPKLFASDIVIHDRRDGSSTKATVKVNEPVTYRGVTLYQSSFEDGGSGMKLKLRSLQSPHDTPLDAKVNGTTTLTVDGESYGLEFTGLRVINVENFANDGKDQAGTDVRKVDLVGRLEQHLGSGANVSDRKTLRNVGPSFSYKLRDASGQAREYNNYMLPLELEGHRVYLLGVRDTLADNFRYLRVPVDSKDSMESWLALRRVLADPAQRLLAARQYALGASPPDKPAMQAQLEATALRTLTLFAGAEGLKADAPAQGAALGGLPALSQFIEREVPEPERARVSEVLLRILNGSLFELHKQAEEQLGRPRPTPGDATQAFMTQAVLSLSDAMFYPAPVLMQLDDFQQIQASVFQVTRAPGQTLVYLGAVLLIVGVFAMLYVKERRLWLWLEAAPGRSEQTRVRMALSSNRDSPDLPVEFQALKQRLLHEEA